jgi:hypothetical protein
MLDSGLAPKTVRNLLTFTYAVFERAIARAWCHENPLRYAPRPKRRRAGEANPDRQFLTAPELDAVLRAVPDEVVHRLPAPTRRGRNGPSPPPPPDVLGPVIRVLILAAAMTGLRQSECWGLAGERSMERAADQGAKHIRSRRAPCRWQVGPLDAPVGAAGRPSRP